MAAAVRTSEGRVAPALTARGAIVSQTVTGALAGGLVLSLAEANGGYYPPAWGRTGLVVLCAAMVSLLVRRAGPRSRWEWGTIAAFAGFLSWCAIEAVRPGAATAAVPEVERAALYLVVLWAALILLRRETAAAALAGTLAAIVVLAFQELGQYLLAPPSINAFEGRLLFEPLGYANAAGAIAAMGAALALGVALLGRTVVHRTLSAATLVPLLATVYLSQSRGAALALAGGGLVLLVSAAKPIAALVRLGAALLLPLVGVSICAFAHFGDVQHDVAPGARRTVAAVLAGLTAASVPAARSALRDRPIAEPQTSRRSGPRRRLLIGAALVGCAIGIGIALHHALGDRSAYWTVAWSDFLHHPLLGSGPGSFGQVWLRHRSTQVATNDAHSLYLETLDELGPLGLGLLTASLLLPFAVRRSVRSPYAPIALTAYVVFLIHAALDWDWEMPAVTVAALVLVAVVLVGGRDSAAETPCSPRSVAALATATALAVIPFVAIQAGSNALSAAARSAQVGDWATTKNHAHAAARWQPWSSEPYLLLGQAQAATGHLKAARRSFHNAARRAPTDWRPWFDLAAVTHGQTRAEALKRVLVLDPLGGN